MIYIVALAVGAYLAASNGLISVGACAILLAVLAIAAVLKTLNKGTS